MKVAIIFLISFFLGSFSYGQKTFKAENGKWGIKNKNNEVLIAPQYDDITYYRTGPYPIKINGKYGFIDSVDNEVLPPIYDYGTSRHGNSIIVKKDKKFGFFDFEGNQLLPFEYDYYEYDGLAECYIVMKNDKFQLISSSGKILTEPIYESMLSRSTGALSENNYRAFIGVRIGEYWGYIDSKGQQVTEIIYDRLGDLKHGTAEVCLKGKYGIIDHTGKMLIEPSYDNAKPFAEGLAAVNLGGEWKKVKVDYLPRFVGGKWGYINKEGNLVIPFEYDYAGDFYKGTAKAYIGKNFKEDCGCFEDREWKTITHSGRVVDYYERIDSELSLVKVNGKYGLEDALGRESAACIYDSIKMSSSMTLFPALKDDKWGYINKHGDEVLPFQYDEAYFFNTSFKGHPDKYANVMINNHVKYINDKGEEFIASSNNTNSSYPELFHKDNKFGYRDRDSKKVIVDTIYDYAADFKNGMAVVCQGCVASVSDQGMGSYRYSYVVGVAKFGFIDSTGKEVIPLQYDHAESFDYGGAEVMLGNRYGIINTDGVELIPVNSKKRVRFYGFSEGRGLVSMNGKYGFIDKSGNIIVAIKYSYAEMFEDGKALIKKGKKEFYIDKNGNVIMDN